MTVEVRLEKLSDTMQTATVVRWLKRAGDAVAQGETMAELETEKAGVDLQAPVSGILAQIAVPDGTENVPAGDLLAVIESAPADWRGHAPTPPESLADTAAPHPPTIPAPAAAVSPPADGETAAATSYREATALARAMAELAGVDLAAIAARSTPVMRADIERALGLAAPPADSPQPAPPGPGGAGAISHTATRKFIAARMAQSKQQIPHFYLAMECDVSAIPGLLKRLAGKDTRLTVTALAIKAAAAALRREPAINALWTPAYSQPREINIAVAIATPAGLVAPAIERADQKSLGEIARELEESAARAHQQRLTLHETSSGTFTISNLGMFGVSSLFPIITPGQTAVLGIGAFRDCPVVRNGALTTGQTMTATFAGDHRAIDGAQGAQFLRAFKELIEEPLRLLL